MAITFSKSSGLNDDLWKVTDTTLRMVMQDTDNEKNNDDELVKAMYNVKKSKKFGEKIGSMTEFANFEAVEEGNAYVQDELQAGFSKLIEHTPFLKGFVCTREARDDGQIDMMKVAAANFVRAYKRSRAQFASDALVSEGSTFTFGAKPGFDKTTGDGKGLFDTEHKYKVSSLASANQSNVFTNAFGNDDTMLSRLANIGRNFKNQSGQIMGYTFDTIIIPGNTPNLEKVVKKIIRTDLQVGSTNNDINTEKGLWKLVINHRWEAASGTEPYILMSSEANRELQGNLFYDRVPLDVMDEVQIKTRNLEWSGYCRFSAGFGAWQHVILGGAQVGTTLS